MEENNSWFEKYDKELHIKAEGIRKLYPRIGRYDDNYLLIHSLFL